MTAEDSSLERDPTGRRRTIVLWVVGLMCAGVIATSAVVSAKAASVSLVDDTAACRADLKTLQVAVEAYWASEDQGPETQRDLVDAGFLRSASSEYQLVDGRIELARDSSCPPPPDEVREIAAGPGSVDDEEQGTDDPACAAASAVLDRLSAIDAENVGSLATELESIEQTIRTTPHDLSPTMRTDLESLRFVLDTYRLQVVALDSRRSSVDRPTAQAIDDLEAGLAGFVSVIPAHEVLIGVMPTVAEQCDTRYVSMAAMSVALNDFSESINAFLDTELGDDPEFAIFAELGPELAADLGGRSATSDLTDQFDACTADARAASIGDNRGCDALYHACEDGDMAACNDLFHSTYPDTDYGRFGASCGDRVRLGQIGYGGFCEEFSGS